MIFEDNFVGGRRTLTNGKVEVRNCTLLITINQLYQIREFINKIIELFSVEHKKLERLENRPVKMITSQLLKRRVYKACNLDCA